MDGLSSDSVSVISMADMRLRTKSLLRLVASGPRRRVVGCVDGFHHGKARGWAMDPDEPTSRLVVRMVDASGSLIGQGLADRYRADVQKAGYGDGYYGFALPVAGATVASAARFLCGKLGTDLPRPPPKLGSSAAIFRRGTYTLWLDQPAAGPVISGWAVERHQPAGRRLLCLRGDRKVLCEQRATLYRPDSIEGGSDGFHGFSMPRPRDTIQLFLSDVVSGLEFRIP